MSNVADLPLDQKQALLDIIVLLRNYQLLGMVESRDWIELIFPEFGEVRDRESDLLFKEMANARTTPSNPGNRG